MKKIKHYELTGFIDKSDKYDIKSALHNLPIYPTQTGVIRSLRGYEDVKPIKVKIFVTIEED